VVKAKHDFGVDRVVARHKGSAAALGLEDSVFRRGCTGVGAGIGGIVADSAGVLFDDA